jgi:hypothetical protein
VSITINGSIDNFSDKPRNLGDPATFVAVVTPNDTNALAEVPKALYVGTGGDITMRGIGGSSDSVWKNVQTGAIIPFRAQFIRATGTTASNILALY